uniref:Inclusion body protein n=2 Tax=Gloeothece TaxID=28070 RepID=E0UF69_GLOV7|nr:conserved hypothetical protein [Gloeothece verrucosa PCC 7822]
MTTELKQTPNKFNVIAVIDTKRIRATYPKPSQDKTKPTRINSNDLFLIVSGSTRVIETSEEIFKLELIAKPGDQLSFKSTSIYANSQDATIIYGIFQKNSTFKSFQPNFVTINRAFYNSENPDGLPPKYESITSVSYEAKVSRAGTENLSVYIALYKLAKDGNTQELFGYFSWDFTIEISRNTNQS